MIDTAAPQRKKLSRFTRWENHLETEDQDMPKVPDQRQTVQKVEFRDLGPIVKHFDCRVLQSKVQVTKTYAERKKRDPVFDAFGIGEGEDAIRGNQNITMLHRDNVWHPYYEIQTEEEDLGTKMRNRQAQRRDNDVEGTEIAALKASIEDLAKNQRDENEARQSAALGGQNKKKSFDTKAIQARLAAKEQEEVKQTPDPTGIKLQDIPQNLTSEEIQEEVTLKFGPVARVWVPMDSHSRLPRNRGFAIVNFKLEEHCARAIQEGEISINFACIRIVQAYRQINRDRDGGRDGNRKEFDMLKRRPRD